MTEGAADEPFTFALTVDVCGVEKIDPRIKRGGEEVDEIRRIVLEDAPDARAPQAKLGDVQLGAAKTAHADIDVSGLDHRESTFSGMSM
jgi:hypothetical protein